MTQEEIIEASKNNPRLISVINIMDIEESSSVIYCYNGIIITNFEEDAITLEEISKNLDIDIAEILEKTAKYYKKEQNTLDKLEFLWENIVLEVPISLTKSSGINLKGEGWELNRDEEDDINPELAKLKDIFKGGE